MTAMGRCSALILAGVSSPSKNVNELTQNFDETNFENFKEIYPQGLMRGFYLWNRPMCFIFKITVTKQRLLVEVRKLKRFHLAIFVKNPKALRKDDKLKIIH